MQQEYPVVSGLPDVKAFEVRPPIAKPQVEQSLAAALQDEVLPADAVHAEPGVRLRTLSYQLALGGGVRQCVEERLDHLGRGRMTVDCPAGALSSQVNGVALP